MGESSVLVSHLDSFPFYPRVRLNFPKFAGRESCSLAGGTGSPGVACDSFLCPWIRQCLGP